jgi:nitrogen regulatory protein PII
MKLVIAYIKTFKLEQVGEALKSVGVTGMSVSDISGF